MSAITSAAATTPTTPQIHGVPELDDVVDAAVVAWSATRIARGEAQSLPEPPEHDSDGRPVAIWY